jgi:hypothetical protein
MIPGCGLRDTHVSLAERCIDIGTVIYFGGGTF